MRVTVSILCGTERHQWINPELAKWMTMFAAPEGVELELSFVQDCWPVSHARNKAALDALMSGADWSCQIDNDELPPHPGQLFSRLQAADARRLDIVAVASMWFASSLRVPQPNVLPHELPGTDDDEFFEEVPFIGGGCFCVHRRVFEKLEQPWFTMPHNSPLGTVLPEDFSFCMKAREAGFRVWCAKNLACEHFKTTGTLHFRHFMRELTEGEIAQVREDGRRYNANLAAVSPLIRQS